MQIAERETGTVTVLDLSGKITLGEGDAQLKDKLHSLLHQGKKNVLLNLAEVQLRGQRGPWRAGQRLYDGHARRRQPEAGQRHQEAAGSAVDHEAADRVRDLRFRETRRCASYKKLELIAFRKTTIRFVFVPFELLLHAPAVRGLGELLRVDDDEQRLEA